MSRISLFISVCSGTKFLVCNVSLSSNVMLSWAVFVDISCVICYLEHTVHDLFLWASMSGGLYPHCRQVSAVRGGEQERSSAVLRRDLAVCSGER